MDKKTFSGMCAVLSTLPSQIKWDDGVASVYLMCMKDWDDRVVGALMRHVLMHCDFRPTVAELRRMGLQLFGNIPTKAQALNEIRKVITYWASNRDSHAFDIHACLPNIVKVAGGWNTLGMTTSEKADELLSEAYDTVIGSVSMESYLIKPLEHKMADLLESGAVTVKAITE